MCYNKVYGNLARRGEWAATLAAPVVTLRESARESSAMFWTLAACFFIQSIIAAGHFQPVGVLISASLAIALVLCKYADDVKPDNSKPVDLRKWTGERSFSTGGWVYVIKDADISGYCKIGKTRQPYNRMKAFGVKLPIRTELIHVIKCDNCDAAEVVIHRRYDQYRKRGEWFDLPESVVKELKQVHEIKNKGR